MRTWLGWLVTSLILVLVASYIWTHKQRVAVPTVGLPAAGPQQEYAEAKEAQKMITITGPMANYVARQQQAGDADVETLQPMETERTTRHLGNPSPEDHVGDSPVGTSTPLLHKTFGVPNIVDLPFEIPAHAATPQLRGTYRSFVQPGVKQASTQSSDSAADVEFLIVNEKQYADLVGGRPADAVFSVDDTHYQEVNFSIPPTWDHPAKYYLVFRNGSVGKGKKFVQADFRIDY